MRERPTHEQSASEGPTAQAGDQVVTSEEPRGRYVAGDLPPVAPQPRDHAAPNRTASEVAFEQDDNTRELQTKVGGLIASKFGGDYKAAFAHYDANKDGGIDKAELGRLLSDAGVGNNVTRGTWASRIVEKLDTSGDAKIEWSEFESVFATSA